jgi:hypothetical protein
VRLFVYSIIGKSLILLAIIFFSSCDPIKEYQDISEINLSNSEHDFKIAIEGSISSLPKLHFVKLEKPVQGLELTKQEPISDAIVSISDGENEYELVETVNHPLFTENDIYYIQGLYATLDSTLQGEVGKRYTLKVIWNDEVYYASDSLVAVDTFDFEKIKLPTYNNSLVSSYDWMYEIQRHDFGYDLPNGWTWSLNFPNKVNSQLRIKNYTHSIIEPQGLHSDVIYAETLNIPKTEDSGLPDSLKVYKFSFSNIYYDYLIALLKESDWKIGYFTTIPGNPPSNVSSGGTGFFFATDVFEKKIHIDDFIELIESK